MSALPLLLPRDAKRFDVAGLGQNSLDIVGRLAGYPEPDSHQSIEDLVRLPGGEIATAMVACARLGCRATYIGTVGKNADGAEVEGALTRELVDLSHLRRVDAPNRVAIILVDTHGRRTVLWNRHKAISLCASDIDPAAVTSGRVLMVDAMDPDASAAAAEYARAARVPTVIDIDTTRPGVDRLLGRIDVIIASRDFVSAYTGGSISAGIKKIAADSKASLVVATMGEAGSLAWSQGHEIHTPAFDVTVVDTTGAGDAFRGGFIAAWLRHGSDRPVGGLLRLASAVAALNCRALGAQAGLPRWAEVDVLVTRATGARSN